MKAELSETEIEKLLDEADEAWPDSDFVASVRDWYEDKGFITDRQEEALNNIAEKIR